MVDTSDFILLTVALFVFAMLQLSVNSVLLNNSKVITQTELDYTAVALAQDIADEAREKAFDEKSTGAFIPLKTEDFSTLGVDPGEVYPAFDDIDDYHNYVRVDTTEYGIYKTSCRVDYMDSVDITQVSILKTPYKRLHVQVVSEIGDSVAVTYVKPYF